MLFEGHQPVTGAHSKPKPYRHESDPSQPVKLDVPLDSALGQRLVAAK